jgi:hypothetical protein
MWVRDQKRTPVSAALSRLLKEHIEAVLLMGAHC